jgi:large subunit ribosomal protein L7/L12
MAEPKKKQTATKKEEILESIKGMSVLELSELVKALEEEFGVSAAAAPAGVAAPAAPAVAPAEEEKAELDVILTGVGDKKIEVIKVVRSVTNLGLKEAKALVDGAPNPVKEKIPKEEAEKIKRLLEDAGATVDLK